MAKYEVLDETKLRGTASICVAAPFDEGKAFVESKGYKIISLEENAKLRMQGGKDAFVSRNGNWTREGVIYVPNKGIFLTKNSPIMVNAKEATNCNRYGKEYFLANEQVEEALADSVKISVSQKPIPTNSLGEDAITVYAFGNEAKKYGEFLKETGINEVPVWLVSVTDKSYARQMWLCRLEGNDWSDLDGYGSLFYDGSRVRGVLNESAEGTTKIKGVGIVGGLEKNILNKLRE